MARGTTLGALVTQLRAASGRNVDSTVGQDELTKLKHLLARTQEVLYDDYTWHFLNKRDADKTLAVSQRYYDFPTSLNPDRVNSSRVYTRWGDQWIPCEFGIDFRDHYNAVDSDDGIKLDPVERWDWYVDSNGDLQFEIWPIPATVGKIRFEGVSALSALVAESDKADLDDRLIVLFAASELRAGQDNHDDLLGLANARLRKLKGRAVKSGPMVIGGGYAPGPARQQTTIRIAGA